MFQRESRRWSRVDDIVNTVMLQQPPSNEHAANNMQQNQLTLQQNNLQQSDDGGIGTQSAMQVSAADASEALGSRFRRSGSERLRDGAKAILRRVESLKTRRRKQRNRDGIVIGSPQVRIFSSNTHLNHSCCIPLTGLYHVYLIFLPPPSNFQVQTYKILRRVIKVRTLKTSAFLFQYSTLKIARTD